MNTECVRELFNAPDVTKVYGFTSAWLRKRRRLCLPPAYVRVGRMVKYRRCDLDLFVSGHIVEPDGHGSRGALEATKGVAGAK